MEILNLEGTEDTPKIMLDKKNGIFEISGRSLPEDSAEFYRPVISSKLILDVLSALEDIKGMKIVWYFHEDDEDMEEAGQEFSELVEIPFEFKTY
ncbi:MAG: DUF1987 domain-containing protein [Cytophagia bacterium]|nr:DUF1987 domain-containing protein [Cytophagia bacterium]